MRLAGKVIAITGAASGIGRATAQRCAAEGARIVVADIDPIGGEETAGQIRQAGHEASFCAVDVADSVSVREMVAFAERTYGPLDGLHNNAYWAPVKPLLETTEAEWDRTMAVTLRGVYLGCLHALPGMLVRGHGVILNTSSVTALQPSPGFAAYNTAKAGVVQLTRSIALDYGPAGIRANALLPGTILTPATAQLREDALYVASRLGRTPLGRFGEPAEVANVAAFLLSDEASYVSGAAITVDGGRSSA